LKHKYFHKLSVKIIKMETTLSLLSWLVKTVVIILDFQYITITQNFWYNISILSLVRNERYQKYFAAIEDAERNYKECNNTKFECYRDVIIRDLKPFKKKGINMEMIDVAKTRYTQVQINV